MATKNRTRFNPNLAVGNIHSSSADVQAELFFEHFKPLMEVYEKNCMKTKIHESISPYEYVALGKQLNNYMGFQKHVESQGNLSSLGAIPKIALDVITASQAASVLPLLASIQPIAEEHSVVYFKQIRAMQESGGYQKYDLISDALTRDNPADGTLGSQRYKVKLATGDGSTKTITGNLTALPVRREKFDIVLMNTSTGLPSGLYGHDDGTGNILGFGFSGEINYETGVYEINFEAAPPAIVDVMCMYDVDVDSRESLEKVQANLATKDIKAEIWALASDVGAFANYAFSQRFGRSAIDEVAGDLTNELTRVLNTHAIRKLYANVPAVPAGMNAIVWDKKAPSAVSYAEHKLTFIDAIAQSEALIHYQSGANTANRYICGNLAAATLRGMPEFDPAPDMATVSVGLYGYYSGVPVIRATGVIPDNEIIALSNAGNYFNAPIIYAPFMPLMVTNTVQNPANPFQQTTAAGIWSGMTAVNGALTCKITVDNAGSTGVSNTIPTV